MATSAPRSASASAVAAPRPRDPPVARATLPNNVFDMGNLSSGPTADFILIVTVTIGMKNPQRVHAVVFTSTIFGETVEEPPPTLRPKY